MCGYARPDEHCQLGHNRLSILDLTAIANQPVQSPSGRYWMVYNGEVYNHLAIRELLPQSHRSFRGHSDTETLAVALDHIGFADLVCACDGMFALGVYDQRDKALWLARDFAGIKPLFFGLNSERLVFASQYDQIAAHPAFSSAPYDHSVLKLYLEQHFMPAPFGLLVGTGQLLPGEWMRIDGHGTIRRERYWELPRQVAPTIRERQLALDTVSHALEAAICAELLSDVPLGAFLSGGIDSPLVSYYAQRATTEPLKAFTIGSDSPVHDETEDAKAYAAMMGLDHRTALMDSGDAQSIIADVGRSLHEPMADYSIIPTFLVSKLARKSVKVALSGDGGDELFFGYERFRSISKNLRFQALPYPIKYLLYGTDKVAYSNRHINSAVLASTQGDAHRGLHSRFPKVIMEAIMPELDAVSAPEHYDVYHYPRTGNLQDLLGHMRHAEFYGMMQKTLRKVDLASMAHGLEVRVPFLKKSFIEASLQCDPMLSYGVEQKKQLLKDLLRSKLPQSPIDGRKRGFSVPLGEWMRKALREPMGQLILNPAMHQRFGMQTIAIQRIWDAHQAGRSDHKWILFTLYALFQWEENRAG